MSFISLGLTIATIALPDWRVNDVEGEVVELIKRTQGLWVKCAFFPTGNWQCEDYDRFFIALPAAITGARVFSILSLIFQIISIITQPLGMHCTTLVDHTQEKLKAKLTLGCGALCLLSSICIGIAVSWYAALVVQDYSNFAAGLQNGIETSTQRFIYGTALYIGWAAMSVLFIQSVILCCSSWGDQEGNGYDYQYAAGASGYDGHKSGYTQSNPYQGGQTQFNGGGQNYI